ncbi:hypothetical protein HanPSC8_Chr15g0644131 [Helianthus annuus]|nr:hypothetical protein HanPSC8_Chr15g0644131 [Helianthus annuus]
MCSMLAAAYNKFRVQENVEYQRYNNLKMFTLKRMKWNSHVGMLA